MANFTPNYNLKKPLDTENYDVADQNGNMDTIDAALSPTADPTQVPTGNGPGMISQWINWITNRIKAITGKSNWWDTPAKSIEQLNTDVNAHLADMAHEAGKLYAYNNIGGAL